MAGVFAEDLIGRGERFEGAQRDVLEIADRCRDHIEPGGQRWRVKGGAGDEVAIRPLVQRTSECKRKVKPGLYAAGPILYRRRRDYGAAAPECGTS
jgi:hypothetical protein